MIANIMSFISMIRAVLDLLKYIRNYQAQQEKIKAEKRTQDREQAVDNSVNAETEEEIWNSQEQIVSNKPK